MAPSRTNIGHDHSNYNVIRSRLHVDMDDCIGCLKCERACPVDCIKIDTVKVPERGKDIKEVGHVGVYIEWDPESPFCDSF
ncbi:MAG: hypothetical protein Ct9H300mP9_3070 [Candidatus Neomarinimicrobiota bacterium]|nr:MAG: hypothetical protein Ct9H300mP9_3070 [Candidatus Neomarinimicrobiota bacterium]